MKNHKISIQILFLSTFILLSGCGIFSLQPLYHNKDLLVQTDLIGTWQNKGDKEVVIIDTLGDNKYEFIMVDGQDTIGFEMGLLKLNNQYFIDLFPSDDCSFFGGDDCEMWEIMFKNYVPVHTFMKFDFIDDQITLTEFDNERLIELFGQNRIRLAHEMAGEDDDYVVITASTDDLQKFITRYANDQEAFEETEKYHRL